MKKTYYEKVGRRYVPVSEYDSEYLDSFPKGNHLVICYPGGSSRRYNIDPNYAAMIAAGRVAEEAISRALSEASKIRIPHRANQPLTPGQIKAWKKLQKEMGVDNYPLEWPSYREIGEAGVKAMIEEANKLMTNPAVKKAFEHFLLVAELTKETNEQE